MTVGFIDLWKLNISIPSHHGWDSLRGWCSHKVVTPTGLWLYVHSTTRWAETWIATSNNITVSTKMKYIGSDTCKWLELCIPALVNWKPSIFNIYFCSIGIVHTIALCSALVNKCNWINLIEQKIIKDYTNNSQVFNQLTCIITFNRKSDAFLVLRLRVVMQMHNKKDLADACPFE